MRTKLKTETDTLARRWQEYELERLRIFQEYVLLVTNLEMHANANCVTRGDAILHTIKDVNTKEEYAVGQLHPERRATVD